MNKSRHWFLVLRIYIAATVTANVIWEVVQLPLYTIWSIGSRREIMFAVIHCSVGDFMISTLALVAALLIFGDRGWSNARFIPVMIATLVMGLGYTVCSEGLNTIVRHTWTYSSLMPKLPPIGTGLSLLLQWIIVPTIGIAAISYFLPRSSSDSLT